MRSQVNDYAVTTTSFIAHYKRAQSRTFALDHICLLIVFEAEGLIVEEGSRGERVRSLTTALDSKINGSSVSELVLFEEAPLRNRPPPPVV